MDTMSTLFSDGPWFFGRWSWLADQEVRGSIPGLAATISEIGFLLLQGRDMAEISVKRRKSSKQPTKNYFGR